MALLPSVSLKYFFPKWVSLLKSKFSVKISSWFWHLLWNSSVITPGSGQKIDPNLMPLWPMWTFFCVTILWLWLSWLFCSFNILSFHFHNLPILESHRPFSASFSMMISCDKSSEISSVSIAFLVAGLVSNSGGGGKKNQMSQFTMLSLKWIRGKLGLTMYMLFLTACKLALFSRKKELKLREAGWAMNQNSKFKEFFSIQKSHLW